jgi:AcrR family transcriptional regulator
VVLSRLGSYRSGSTIEELHVKSSTPSAKLRRPKDPETSREEYLQAATALFTKKGFFRTSVDDIIRKAGRSKGGFYHHFKSKNELMRAMFKKMMNEFGGALLDGIRNGKPIGRAFQSYLNSPPIREIMDSKYMNMVAELYAMALHDRGVRELMRDFHREAIGLFEEVLVMGKANGELAFEEPSHQLAESLYHALRGSMLIDLILNGGKNIPRDFEFTVQWILRALGKKT